MNHLDYKPYWIKSNPLYHIENVGLEVEKILRNHGFENICFRIPVAGKPLVKATLS